MKQSFKLEINSEYPDLLRADLEVRNRDGSTVVLISTPVSVDLLKKPLKEARSEVLRSVIALLQDQSQTP